MRLRDLFLETLSAFNANRGRSLLTILGIVIGISAVIAMTSLIDGIKYSLLGSLGLNQSRMVTIYAAPDRGVTEQDLEQLAMGIPDYEFVTGIDSASERLGSAEKQFDARIIGCRPEYFTVMGFAASTGSLLSQSDVSGEARNVVLDRVAAEKVFGSEGDAVGKTVRINNGDYTVVGTCDSGQGASGGERSLLSCYMPYSTFTTRVSGSKAISEIYGYAREGANMKTLAERTKAWLIDWFSIPESEAEGRISVMTLSSIIERLDATMASFQVLVTAIAGISLLVGGIGIMNMMLTNVTERIREIGLRKALGARAADITRQFLFESILLCVTGGVIGVALGYAAAWGLAGSASAFLHMETSVTPIITPSVVLMTSGTCIGIGLVFGYWPARRAARLNPVESLRYQ